MKEVGFWGDSAQREWEIEGEREREGGERERDGEREREKGRERERARAREIQRERQRERDAHQLQQVGVHCGRCPVCLSVCLCLDPCYRETWPRRNKP